MPYEITYEFEDVLLRVDFEGTVDAETLDRSMDDRLQDPERFKRVRVMVLDFTRADMKGLVPRDLREDVPKTERMVALNPDIDLIGIMPGALEFALSRVWMVYAEKLPWRPHLLTSPAEAEELIKKLINTEKDLM